MEGSRMRTFLGAGLVLLGGLLLLRALAAPVAFVTAPMPAVREVEELKHEQQRAQIEMQRAELEVQRELERAQLDARRELELAKLEAQRALNEIQVESSAAELPPLPPMPELPAMPSLPPMPPVPPPAPVFHIGDWFTPPLVLVALLALLLWRRGCRDSKPQQA